MGAASQGFIWIDVCPLADLILQSKETASLGISRRRTDPPIALLTHLQSHSCDVTEAGAVEVHLPSVDIKT